MWNSVVLNNPTVHHNQSSHITGKGLKKKQKQKNKVEEEEIMSSGRQKDEVHIQFDINSSW